MKVVGFAILALVLTACGGPRYLGATLPDECGRSWILCDGELQLRALRDDAAPLPALERYVASIEARIARASQLDHVPPVLVVPSGNAAVVARTIVVGRDMIVRLGTEAELAAILAHETAHLEAHADELSYVGVPVDEESLADERGVVLLAKAGYPPGAMASALRRILIEDDSYHPPARERVLRTMLVAGSPAINRTRAALLAAIEGAVVGRDLARGARVGDAWIVADRELAVRLPDGLAFETADTHAIAYDGRVRYSAWRLGRGTGRELAARIEVVARRELPVGHVTIGRAAKPRAFFASSLERLLAERRADLGDLDRDELGAVIETAGGTVLLAISGAGDDDVRRLERWLARLRVPTAVELRAAVSPHLVLVRAPHAGTVRELAALCVDPVAARELDDPDRALAAGASIRVHRSAISLTRPIFKGHW